MATVAVVHGCANQRLRPLQNIRSAAYPVGPSMKGVGDDHGGTNALMA